MRSGILKIKCLKILRLMKELRGIWRMQRIAHATRLAEKSWKK